MRTRILIAVYQEAASYAMKLLLDEQPDMAVTGVVDNNLGSTGPGGGHPPPYCPSRMGIFSPPATWLFI